MSRHFDWAFLKHGNEALLASYFSALPPNFAMQHKLMSNYECLGLSQFFFSPFSFSLVIRVTTWVQASQVSFFSLFLFLCLLKFEHVKYIWVHSTVSLFTMSFLYILSTSPTFFLGNPLHSYLRVPLWLWI